MPKFLAKHRLQQLSVACLSLLSSTTPGLAQHSTQQLEQMLNSVESSSGYSAASQQGNSGQYQAAPFNQSPVMQHPFMNQGNNNWQPSRSVPQMIPNQTIQGAQATNQSPFAKINRARQWMNGGQEQQVQQPAQKPRTGRASIFQTMFGDSVDSSSGDARGNASRAQTQAGIARNAASSSYYGDHYSRSQNADTAYYAAAAARREADAAYYKAQSPNADAATRSCYATARAAADSAQSAADTARANADRTYK
jgi:hypothetical protein